MPSILLVDDDRDTWEAVRLALEPSIAVEVVGTLHAALTFLRARSANVCGVIVDLNLTDGSDNFGRILLERLRELQMPCVVFSASIRSAADVLRYENEFGVMGTIGKGGNDGSEGPPLQRLRRSVERMIDATLASRRDRVRADLDRELVKREAGIERDRGRSRDLVAEAARIGGAAAAVKLERSESARLARLTDEAATLRAGLMGRLDRAGTIEELEETQADVLRSLGVV